jgi:hypothetical protein
VSGRFDVQATKIPSIDEEEIRRSGLGVVFTRCVHIVPESTCLDVFATRTPPETSSESRLAEKVLYCVLFIPLYCCHRAQAYRILSQTDHSASVLAILKRFVDSAGNLNGPKVHSLFNVLTMEVNMYDIFDRLYMWLEATVSGTGTRPYGCSTLIGHLDL